VSNQLRVTSFIGSTRRLAIQSTFASSGANLEAIVDAAALRKLARGSTSVRMEVKEGRLVVRGKGVSGDIPLLLEDGVLFPRVETNRVPATDAAWLRDNLPSVVLSDLRKTGALSAECDGKDWRLTCRDEDHGACMFGKGRCRVKFSLWTPADAIALGTLLSAAEDGEVSIGYEDDLLVVRAGMHLATILTRDGEAITREVMTSGTTTVAIFEARDLRDSLEVLKPVAMAKDADLVRMTLKTRGIVLSANGPNGSVESEFAAECKTEIECGLNYRWISALAASAHDRVVLGVRKDEGEINRITLKCGELFLVMLTADHEWVTARSRINA
jgi:hypothetical protein